MAVVASGSSSPLPGSPGYCLPLPSRPSVDLACAFHLPAGSLVGNPRLEHPIEGKVANCGSPSQAVLSTAFLILRRLEQQQAAEVASGCLPLRAVDSLVNLSLTHLPVCRLSNYPSTPGFLLANPVPIPIPLREVTPNRGLGRWVFYSGWCR